jgi:hypothetical protein
LVITFETPVQLAVLVGTVAEVKMEKPPVELPPAMNLVPSKMTAVQLLFPTLVQVIPSILVACTPGVVLTYLPNPYVKDVNPWALVPSPPSGPVKVAVTTGYVIPVIVPVEVSGYAFLYTSHRLEV